MYQLIALAAAGMLLAACATEPATPPQAGAETCQQREAPTGSNIPVRMSCKDAPSSRPDRVQEQAEQIREEMLRRQSGRPLD